MKPRIRIKAISQFVQATPHETAVAQAPPRPAESATAVSVSLTFAQFEDLNRRPV